MNGIISKQRVAELQLLSQNLLDAGDFVGFLDIYYIDL